MRLSAQRTEKKRREEKRREEKRREEKRRSPPTFTHNLSLSLPLCRTAEERTTTTMHTGRTVRIVLSFEYRERYREIEKEIEKERNAKEKEKQNVPSPCLCVCVSLWNTFKEMQRYVVVTQA